MTPVEMNKSVGVLPLLGPKRLHFEYMVTPRDVYVFCLLILLFSVV